MSDTTGIVVFDYPHWKARYPEFAGVSQAQAERYFDDACLFCDNTATSPVCILSQRSHYLDMLTAHIAALSGALSGECGGGASAGAGIGVSGRIQSASEGSVSVSFADLAQGDGPNAAWYQQTPYGALYWQATAQYRTWRYYIGPQPFPEAYNNMWGRLGSWRRW